VAVIDVKETWHSRRGQRDDKLQRSYVRSWRVITDDVHTEQAAVLSAVGVSVHDAYSADSAALVRLVKCEQKDDEPRLWMVEAEYSTEGRDPAKQAEEPTSRPPVITWTNSLFQRPATTDIDGNPITNSAREAFDPPVDVDDVQVRVSIVRYEATFNEATAAMYLNSVNSDFFYGQGPGLWRCVKFDGKQHHENNSSCWEVSYEFEYRWQGWELRVLDQGYHERIDGKRVKILDEFGQPVSQPVPLNGFGQKLDRARTTLTAGLTADTTDELVEVEDRGDFDFPRDENGGEVRLRIGGTNGHGGEVVVAYDTGADSFSVHRAQGGTEAQVHAIGAAVWQEPTYLPYKVYRETEFAELDLP
jgi:hypothetical protein